MINRFYYVHSYYNSGNLSNELQQYKQLPEPKSTTSIDETVVFQPITIYPLKINKWVISYGGVSCNHVAKNKAQ
jgi:hypothetical protein